MIRNYAKPIIIFIWFLCGCAPQMDPALVKEQQKLLESSQTRVFDASDQRLVMRSVVYTFQDLRFIINNADAKLGVISAKKFGEYPIEMTVTVRPISTTQVSVHGIARYDSKPIEDPAIYEQFFSSFQKVLSLTAHSNN